MLLTKDNLLRFVRERKYVTPTNIAEKFETSTMIGSAALSELVKNKSISITNIKIGSTPYYYDHNQKECLIEIGENQLKKYEKEVFDKLKEQQVLPDSYLSIQQRLAAEGLKDFAKPLEIDAEGKIVKFWVWFLRDIDQTEKQIRDVINGKSGGGEMVNKEEIKKEVKQEKEEKKPSKKEAKPVKVISTKKDKNDTQEIEQTIESYLRENGLVINSKNRNGSGIMYKSSLKLNRMSIVFECYYYFSKVKEHQLISFYAKSNCPKIVFLKSPSKKLIKLCDSLENLHLVSLG